MSISIYFPSGRTKEYSEGITAGEICNDPEFFSVSSPIVAVRLNNEISCLATPVMVDSAIEPILLQSREGTDIYRRSLCFLLAMASKQMFPDRRLIISHSLGNGYFYYFDGLNDVPQEDLTRLEERMQEMVSKDLEIRSGFLSYSDAVSYFERANQYDTVLLLKYKNESKIAIYKCGDFVDLFHGPHVPNTGLLEVFQLMNYPPGFLLRYPPLGKFEANHALFSIYRESLLSGCWVTEYR